MKIIEVDSCRSCPYMDGWERCQLEFEPDGEGEGRSVQSYCKGSTTPSWCPLADGDKASQLMAAFSRLTASLRSYNYYVTTCDSDWPEVQSAKRRFIDALSRATEVIKKGGE